MAKVPRLQLRYFDNNSGVSKPGYYLPAGTSETVALDYANALRLVLSDLTDASLQGARLTIDLDIEPGPPAAPSSDNGRKLALFYRTGSILGSLVIPSPVMLTYDLAGPWADFRLTRDSAISANILDEIEAIVTGTVFKNNNVFPNIFTVGAIEEIIP